MTENSTDSQHVKRYVGKSWSEFIGAIRFISGSTQDMFAESIGTTSSTVGRWEKGDSPQVRYQRKLTDMFELTNHEVIQLRGGQVAPGEIITSTEREQLFGAFVTRIANGPPLSEVEGQILQGIINLP